MTASAIQPAQTMPLVPAADFSAEQIDLIKQTVAAGTSDLELALFLEVAKSSGLNPFQRQIYAVMRWDAKSRKEKMVIQTGIDGYRLIAARSGAHMGTTDPEFGPITKEGFPEFARVIVRKLVHGQLAEFPATARWSEYVQTGKEGPTAMWKRMPHTMLGKCAEALALRKAFPAELSGVYSDVEMAQADNAAPEAPRAAAPAPQSRHADVTREVAQAAGVPLQTTGPSDTLTTEIRRLWSEARPHIDEAAYAARFPAWRTDAAQAGALRQELQKVLGNRPAPEPQAAPEVPTIAAPPSAVQDTPAAPAPTDVQAEVLLSDSQRKALCGHATRAGAKSSEDRALIWGHLLNAGQPVGTKTLTEAQAHTILGMFSDWGNEEAAAVLAEAKNTILPF